MSLQSKGFWNMTPSSQKHVRMWQATGKDKCKPMSIMTMSQAGGVGGAVQLRLGLPPDPKQRVTFMRTTKGMVAHEPK